MRILILAEKVENELHPNVQSAFTAAKQIQQQSQLSAEIEIVTANSVTSDLASLAEKYIWIIGCQRNTTQAVLAGLAAKLDRAMITGVNNVITTSVFERTIYAGRIVETVDVGTNPVVISIDINAFAPTVVDNAKITHLTSERAFEKISETKVDVSKPNLTTAKSIVAIGGGIGEAENLAIIEPLVEKLNATLGAGRGAIDAGILGTDALIGQSGKTVAPDLYIAIGISGASQHIAGIKDSKTIIAINKDPQAPIFTHADYGIVGDFREIVPKLVASLD